VKRLNKETETQLVGLAFEELSEEEMELTQGGEGSRQKRSLTPTPFITASLAFSVAVCNPPEAE